MHVFKVNQSGFSLISVSIAAGLLGVVALGASSLITDMITGQNTTRIKGEMEAFHDELRSHLSNQTACSNSFAGLGGYTNGRTFNVARIMNADTPATVRYVPNTTYNNANFQIESMNLDYVDTPAVPGTGEGTLTMRYRSLIPMLGPQTVARNIRIAVNKNTTTNAMTACVSKGRMTDGLWLRSLANQNNIYYPGGRVGIGAVAASPLWDLDIAAEGRPVITTQRTYSDNNANDDSAIFSGVRGRGTAAAARHVLAGDRLAAFVGSPALTNGTWAHMDIVATENHTNTAQGQGIVFITPQNGTVRRQTGRLLIDHDGAVYIGNGAPNPRAKLWVSGGIRAIRGNPNGLWDAANAGYTFDLDGDSGFFSSGGNLNQDNTLSIYSDGVEVVNFRSFIGTTFLRPTTFELATTLRNTLNVQGATTLASTTVNGTMTVNGALSVTGCISSNTGMTVGGTCASDRRFKENLEPMPPVADQLAKINPTYYTWKPEYLPQGLAPDQQVLGLIAQDVAAALPNLVEVDSKGFYKVKYSDLTMYLLRGFSEHHDRLAQMTVLEQKQTALEDENKTLKEALSALSKRLELVEKQLTQSRK